MGLGVGSPEEMWHAAKSTLLQVLVSIQSMILIDLPYFNEYVFPFPPSLAIRERDVRRPGYGQSNPNSPASQAYNRNVSLQTTRWAIVEWLKDEHKDGIWGVRPSLLLHRHHV